MKVDGWKQLDILGILGEEIGIQHDSQQILGIYDICGGFRTWGLPPNHPFF